MPNEMVHVEVKPGQVMRVNPRDLDTFMEQHPGATQLDGDQAEAEGAEAESKAVDGPPANKAQRAPRRTTGTANRRR